MDVGVVVVLLLVQAIVWLWRLDATMNRAHDAALEAEGKGLEKALLQKEEARRRAEREEAGVCMIRASILEAERLLGTRRALADGAVRHLQMAQTSQQKEVGLFALVQ